MVLFGLLIYLFFCLPTFLKTTFVFWPQLVWNLLPSLGWHQNSSLLSPGRWEYGYEPAQQEFANTWFGQGSYDCEIMTPRKAVNILTIHGQNTNGIPLQFVLCLVVFNLMCALGFVHSVFSFSWLVLILHNLFQPLCFIHSSINKHID